MNYKNNILQKYLISSVYKRMIIKIVSQIYTNLKTDFSEKVK